MLSQAAAICPRAARPSPGQQPSSSLGQRGTPVPSARCSQSFWPSALSALVTIHAELMPAARGSSGCLY